MKEQAAIYLRLSRDDGENVESNSISNQRQLINNYCNSKKIEIYDEYIDDGYSGVNFNRPSFKRMIRDMEDKKFNMIIVKDLSRFGRDYIESGRYLQKIFPEKNIRFISINDSYDSKEANTSDTHLILPIRNFINDSYCRDISTKVKSSQKTKREKGEFIGAFSPFGYKKDPKDKHRLVVDNKAKIIVKRIFSMKIQGYSSQAIANYLNKIGTPTPSKHRENNGIEVVGFVPMENKWQSKMINRILTNRVYIGNLEQGKVTKLNYKSDKTIQVAKSDWVVIENAHTPIISKNEFNIANNLVLRDMFTRDEKPTLLSGMLFCADCGSQMIKRTVKYKGRETVHYICGTHSRNNECSRHGIREDYILERVKYLISNFLSINKILYEKLRKIDFKSINLDIEFDYLVSEKKKYETLRQSLFMDLEDDLINEEEFGRYKKNYTKKILEIEEQIRNKKMMIDEIKENLLNEDSNVDFDKNEKLTRNIITYLIDKILIHENKIVEVVFYEDEKLSLIKSIIENKKRPQFMQLDRKVPCNE